MTMTTTATERGEKLLSAINSKDALHALTEVQQYREMMRDAALGPGLVVWISEPANLTRVHKALAEDLGVPPKILAIKRVSMTRTMKAALLTQAMELAIKKVHKL